MKLPAVLAFTLLGGGAVLGLGASCTHHAGPSDAAVGDARTPDAGPCMERCIHDDPTQSPCGCVDSSFTCPTDCRACSVFCIPTSSDGGTAQCPDCAAADSTCPSGCEPIG